MAATVLIVEDEETFRLIVSDLLQNEGYEVFGAESLAEARAQIRKGIGEIIILDVMLKDGNGLQLLTETAHLPVKPQVIVMTAVGEIGMAVDAMKNGAQDFLQKPLDLNELKKAVERAEEIVSMRRELNHLRSKRDGKSEFIIGSTPTMKRLVSEAQRASNAAVSVLITGETGTGKEVLTNFIYKNGPRASKPFIDINCPAVPAEIFESELFGHESGAFTDARQRRNGLMEAADGGILFLDEIASMPTVLQAKLLRAIQEKYFRRVGGNTLIHVDVQIIAASNRNLKEMIKNNTFREDLYYRLKVVDLNLPPLSQRKEDIPDLVGYFLQKFNQQQGANITDVSPRAMQAMTDYPWPGNIRDLSNAIERAVLLCDESTIDIQHLPIDVINHSSGEDQLRLFLA